MYKKLISSILAFALLTQIMGCYSYQEITKEEFNQTEEYADLQVKTTNQYIYQFDEDKYTVIEDSIYGSGKLKLKNGIKVYEDYSGSVSLKDIESFKFDRFNLMGTIIAIGISVGILVLIANSIEIIPEGKSILVKSAN